MKKVRVEVWDKKKDVGCMTANEYIANFGQQELFFVYVNEEKTASIVEKKGFNFKSYAECKGYYENLFAETEE